MSVRRRVQSSLIFAFASLLMLLSPPAFAAAPCAQALAQLTVCESANTFATNLMKSRHLQVTSVVQDVSTGALLIFASSQPDSLDVVSEVLPLSLSKLYLAASWWDHHQPDSSFEASRPDAQNPASPRLVNIQEMLVNSIDYASEQAAIALRKSVGTSAVMDDLQRYGFNSKEPFWKTIDSQWKSRLNAPPANANLADLNDHDWGTALSIGEHHMTTTPLHISRFLQAVGNSGVQCSPVAFQSSRQNQRKCANPVRIMQAETATRLTKAMLDTVRRGTASQISKSLADTGWSIGGRTGTGGRVGAPMEQQDGWFAGLILDPKGKARFTVATFVRQGGRGGGNAAEISAAIARYLIATP
jgi:cell division protein FtsI/penicillin-binding protein 2